MLKDIVSDATLGRTVRLIEATARHTIPAGLPDDEAEDMALFLDMDLSILGAAPADFDTYEAGVRHEYREVADTAFRHGRADILEGFLAREYLYFSNWGRALFEAAA